MSLRLAHAAAQAATVLLSAVSLAACNTDPSTAAGDPSSVVTAPGTHLKYGTPLSVGNGRARTYVIVDERRGGVPTEIGVALDERALDGLPAPSGDHGPGHGDMQEFLLALPQGHGTPLKFVELNWNPGGHEPPGVYDAPHFDVHFYTTTREQRDLIDPARPQYAAEANTLPAPEFIPQFYALPLPPGVPPVAAAVPRMGIHLSDMRSPELQKLLGNPDAYKPFTTTFIMGSWNGQVTFFEPMITREYILSKKSATEASVRDEVIALPQAQKVATPGYYPAAYRIMWDAQAKEYRIALTQLTSRN